MNEIDKHNKEYVKELNNKLGDSWSLTYKSEKIHPKISIKRYSIQIVNNDDKTTSKIPMMKLDSNPPFSNELLLDRLNLYCGSTPDKLILNNLRDDCTKIFNVEQLAEQLQSQLKLNLDRGRTSKIKI